MTAAAIIVAAGRGARLGAPDKILLQLGGRSLLSYSIDAAEAAVTVNDIIVVAGLHTKAQIELLVRGARWRKVSHVALGGERRQDSVEAGLRLVRDGIDVVAVHDGARPLVTPELFDACVTEASRSGAAIVAVPLTDTLKRAGDMQVLETISRENIWAAQTPQAFRTAILREAFTFAHHLGLDVTDESSLVEAQGIAVTIVKSTSRNLKVTRPEDLVLAEALLAAAKPGGRR